MVIVVCVLVFFFHSRSALSNAKMDMVRNKFVVSKYKDLPQQWFNPQVSWTNKHNPVIWRAFAITYLPTWLFKLTDKYKPAYDPLSDFWHVEKVKMKLYELAAFLVALVGLYFETTGIGIVLLCVAWVAGWNLTFNRHLKSLKK